MRYVLLFFVCFTCCTSQVYTELPEEIPVQNIHCFEEGTVITMSDLTKKQIQNIWPEDRVLSYDFKNDKFVESRVVTMIDAKQKMLYEFEAENMRIVTTCDHPFYVMGKGWASICPEYSNWSYVQEQEVKRLQGGDEMFSIINGRKGKARYEYVGDMGYGQAYTIELADGDNFFANGFLVKTEVPDKKKTLRPGISVER